MIRFLGEPTWLLLEELRGERRTGHSARMLFEVLGDMWVITRNPFIQDDLLENKRRRRLLVSALHHRLDQIIARAAGNEKALQLEAQARTAVKNFSYWFDAQHALRQKAQRVFGRVTRHDNIDYSGIARVSHVTDATDWRVEFPFVVLTPDSEAEIPLLVKACAELDLTMIARGGGTGYTGGAVPLYENTAVINMEKLEALAAVEQRMIPGHSAPVATVRCDERTTSSTIITCAPCSASMFRAPS